jgi:hypothetical protein
VQGVVTVNSTVGLRAIMGQTPTFALGEALYRLPGLVFSGTLDEFWTQGAPPDEALREGFLRSVAHSLHIRGVYHAREGREVAMHGMVQRLHEGILNRPVPEALDPETEGATAGFWPPAPEGLLRWWHHALPPATRAEVAVLPRPRRALFNDVEAASRRGARATHRTYSAHAPPAEPNPKAASV